MVCRVWRKGGRQVLLGARPTRASLVRLGFGRDIMKIWTIALAGAAFAAFAATAVAQDTSHHPVLGGWGVDLTSMDKSVKPGDNFFMYVNGTWYKNAVIPP